MRRGPPKAPAGAALAPETRVVGEGFHEQVYDLVRQIPRGRVTSYGRIATALGSPRVARHVGWALAALPAERDGNGPASVPWHRVLNASGFISHRGDLARAEVQSRRLQSEGVAFDAAGRCDLARYGWTPEDPLAG